MFAVARLVGVMILWLSAVAPMASAGPDKVLGADTATLQTCLAGAGRDGTAMTRCIGVVSGPCLDRPENASTLGMVTCVRRETAVWDGLLNAAYQESMRRLDEKPRAELRQIQRLWIKWRDAKCAFPYALYEGGTMAQPVSANCIMDTTARRAIELNALKDQLSGR